jgi:hypothetical protein
MSDDEMMSDDESSGMQPERTDTAETLDFSSGGSGRYMKCAPN